MVSTLAGKTRLLFSETSAAAVTGAIMKPELDAAVLDQKRRQPAHLEVGQHGDAPLGERTDLAHRDRERMGEMADHIGLRAQHLRPTAEVIPVQDGSRSAVKLHRVRMDLPTGSRSPEAYLAPHAVEQHDHHQSCRDAENPLKHSAAVVI